MSTLPRILLVEDTPLESELARSSLARSGLLEHMTLVKDQDEALDFLYARGPFQRRPSGLPAVVVLGPNLRQPAAFSLLTHIRTDATLRRLPVVMIAAEPDGQTVRTAYEQGANSLIRRHENADINAERYEALASFWARANHPPPGCLRPPEAQRAAP
jgi:CheY-like chemotaxis protein